MGVFKFLVRDYGALLLTHLPYISSLQSSSVTTPTAKIECYECVTAQTFPVTLGEPSTDMQAPYSDDIQPHVQEFRMMILKLSRIADIVLALYELWTHTLWVAGV
jgi:hypothetical protein